MTAEVAILNKLAVALAADSAVTTGFPGKEKIFTSANKIFTLSKHAPIGVMIYGHVEHFSIPWETIIKEFRRELKGKRYPLVSDYVTEFRRFFSQPRIISENQQELSVLIACASTYATLESAMVERRSRWTAANIAKELDNMEEFTHAWRNIPDLSGVTFNKFTRKYNHVLDAFIKDEDKWFDTNLPVACRRQFKYCVFLSMCIEMPSSFASGIVVAGFGEDELFPTLKEIQVDGGIFDTVRVVDKKFVDIERSKNSIFVGAFAQQDVVKAFMQGFDDEYQDYMTDMLTSFMDEHTKEILKEHTSYGKDEVSVILELVRSKMRSSIEDFRKELLDFCNVTYMKPVEEVLRSAPKDELAHVAEALVSLTSLKRRVSGEKETVGGPVDVAVVSKGDGFIWIKRKHYFSRDLNPYFIQNYFEEVPSNAEIKQAARSAGQARQGNRGSAAQHDSRPAKRPSRQPGAAQTGD